MRKRFMIIYLLLMATFSLMGQNKFTIPQRGFHSDQPAINWEHSLLSGNGTMGIMVIGEPYDETITVDHNELFLPNEQKCKLPDVASQIPEMRKAALEGNYSSIGKTLMDARKGYVDQRDTYIGGFNLKIHQNGGKVVKYQRGVNYETAETFVEWQDANGFFSRTAFVSRADSMIIIRLTGQGKINCSLAFEQLSPQNDKERKMMNQSFRSQSVVTNGWLTFKASFLHQNLYNTLKGYEGLGRIVTQGGSIRTSEDSVAITDANEVLIFIKIEPIRANEVSKFETMKQSLQRVGTNYTALLDRQKKSHNALFSKVSLNLNGNITDLALSSDSIIRKSDHGELSNAMVEKLFDAARYNIVCCTGGINPPNLQGLWSATWSAPWSGSFTTNGNLPTAIAFLLSGNTPELMQSYFNYTNRSLPGYRENAQKILGCRGIHIPAQLTTSPLITDFQWNYPHCFWTGGAGWAAWQYYDYYRYTEDKMFLKTTAYPFMKEAALFYEDWLIKGKDGKYIFAPSFSPENSPEKEFKTPSVINATMDIAIARQLLRSCIASAKILNTDGLMIKKWKEMLTKLPNYEVNESDGCFREWLWPGLQENNWHRHASHLYPLYDEMPAEIVKNPKLVKAVQTSIDKRYEYRAQPKTMAFGLVQEGLAAAHIGSVRQATFAIDQLSRNNWTNGFGSFHDPKRCFNMDISGGYPYLISQCLVYSEPGYIKLLPCLPEQWKSGSIKGLLLRGNITLQSLNWDDKRVSVTLLSSKPVSEKVELNGKVKTIKLKKDQQKVYTFKL